MQIIEITTLTGHSPYDITICDITKSYCYVVSSGVTSAPITVEIPTELSGTQELIVVITDSSGCETFSNYNCFTPTPTPTPTITPTITPTNISCNCITFTNTGTTIGAFSYIDCDNQEINFKINSGTTLYVCGKSPSIIVGDVTYSMGLPCVNNTCIPPTPTPTVTPSATPVIVDCSTYVVFNTGTTISKYDINTNTLTPLTFPNPLLIGDVANSYGRFWTTSVAPPYELTEYSIIPTPFSAVYNKTLNYSFELNGLVAKDNTTLISTRLDPGSSSIVVEFNVSGGNGSNLVVIDKFSLPGTNRNLGGDLAYLPTTDKLFVTSNGTGGAWITQFDYTTGNVDYDVNISLSVGTNYGISSKDGYVYIYAYNGDVYRVDSMSVPTFTLVQTTTAGINAASSDPSCAIVPTPTPTPTMTQTIGCITPILNSVTPLSGSTYGFIFSTSYNCTSVDIEYSRDTITWTADTGTCSTSRIVDTGDGSGTWYFRIIQLCGGNYLTGNTLTYIPTSPNPTPTVTPTPTYPYNNIGYTYIVPEPQDVTSLSDLSAYMTSSGSTFLGWGNSGLPSTIGYSTNLDIYIHYSGFTGGSGNFISNVGNLKSANSQLSDEAPPYPFSSVTDMFGCETLPYFNTIVIEPTDVNPNIQYFYTIWIAIRLPFPSSVTNTLVNIGYGEPCTSSILDNGAPDSVLFSQNVFVTSGAVIPTGYYRVLWLDPSCLLPTVLPPPELELPLFFKASGFI
jgi:hypothetical protein